MQCYITQVGYGRTSCTTWAFTESEVSRVYSGLKAVVKEPCRNLLKEGFACGCICISSGKSGTTATSITLDLYYDWPRVTYAVLVWWKPDNHNKIGLLLDKVQSLGYFMVTSAFKTTLTTAMEALLGALLLHIVIEFDQKTVLPFQSINLNPTLGEHNLAVVLSIGDQTVS